MLTFSSVKWEERYFHWNTQSLIIPQSFMWYRTNNLIYYLHLLRHFILTNENECPILLHEAIPATEHCRFPNDTSYMCEGIGDWNIHLDTIYAWLNILTCAKALDKSHFQTVDEVELMILEKINVLLQCAAQKRYLITQTRFEEMYNLEWKEFIILDYKSMPFILVGFVQRADRIWRTALRYKYRFLMQK